MTAIVSSGDSGGRWYGIFNAEEKILKNFLQLNKKYKLLSVDECYINLIGNISSVVVINFQVNLNPW